MTMSMAAKQLFTDVPKPLGPGLPAAANSAAVRCTSNRLCGAQGHVGFRPKAEALSPTLADGTPNRLPVLTVMVLPADPSRI